MIEDIKFKDTHEGVLARVLMRKSKTDQLTRPRRLNLSIRITEALNLLLKRSRNSEARELFKGINQDQGRLIVSIND